MENKNYKIVFPISNSREIEITSKTLANKLKTMPDTRKFTILESTGKDNPQFKEITHSNKLPVDILRFIELSQNTMTNLMTNHKTFMIATATGFKIFQSKQIVCFEYNKTKKQWSVILNDQSCFQIKRKTTANDILSYATSFFRINHQYIINLEYLTGFENKKCILSIHIAIENDLIISRSYQKILQENIQLI